MLESARKGETAPAASSELPPPAAGKGAGKGAENAPPPAPEAGGGGTPTKQKDEDGDDPELLDPALDDDMGDQPRVADGEDDTVAKKRVSVALKSLTDACITVEDGSKKSRVSKTSS